MNGDGVPDVAVGAPGQDGGKHEQGQVFVFSGATGQWLQTLNTPFPERGGRFGSVLVTVGDLDGDGRPELAVDVFVFSIDVLPE